MTTFRDNDQRGRVCRELLRMHGMARFFEQARPSTAACDELRLAMVGQSLLSMGELTLLRVAFDIWNGSGDATVYEIQSRLAPLTIVALGELLVASNTPLIKGNYVDEWIERWSTFNATPAVK